MKVTISAALGWSSYKYVHWYFGGRISISVPAFKFVSYKGVIGNTTTFSGYSQ